MFTEEQAAGYLAGIVDGEGHIRAHRSSNREITIANTDWELIQAVKECCEVLGLECRVLKPRILPSGKQFWESKIVTRESLLRVLDIVPMRITRKVTRLKEAEQMFKRSPKPSREWLEQKYVTEGLTGPEVGKLANTSYARVYKWLREYGIPIRSTVAASRLGAKRRIAKAT